MKLVVGILLSWVGAAILLAALIQRALKALRQADDAAMRAFADAYNVEPDPKFIHKLAHDLDLWEEELAKKDNR